nr:glycosyl hydrolase family 28-related protein [Microlunatus antarcticus]
MFRVLAAVVIVGWTAAGCGSTTEPPPPPSTTTPATTSGLSPQSFGAVGDGSTDDTAALQRALDALRPGQTLDIAAGKVYRHSDILTVRQPDVSISGSGTFLATNEDRSEVLLDADRVVVDGPTFKMQSTTRRGETFEQMKLRLADHTGIVVRNVVIDGSSAAGVYVGSGVSNFLLENLQVRDTRADGIHITGTAHDGVVRKPVVDRAGDDGVAVVSYLEDKEPVRRVMVESPTVRNSTGGRGVSVVGGEDITYTDVNVLASSSAAVYIASEGSPYYTFAPERVKVVGATLVDSNTAASVDHGAFLVYAGNPGHPPSDISASDVTIRGTRPGASSQVGVRADPSCTAERVTLTDFTVEGGGKAFLANVPASSYTRSGWKV